jgi:hypothetical protein
MIPVTAIVAAKLGICNPFSLEIAGRRWTFSRNRHAVAANTIIRFESHMIAMNAYEARGSSLTSVTTIKLAS